MDKALELLSFRARSERELEIRLCRAGHPSPAVRSVLGRCRELGYLDDDAFALAYVRDRLRLRPRGRRALRSELAAKGVDPATIERAVETAFVDAGVEELDLARRCARKHAGTFGAVEPWVARRRLTGYLARRGFPPDAVRQVVGEVISAADVPSSPERD